jgi:hypothetical protein
MFDCSLRSRGSRFEAAAFLSRSQTKSVSGRSFVQDSGARSWARGIKHRRERPPGSLLAPFAEAGVLRQPGSVRRRAISVSDSSLRSLRFALEAASFRRRSQTIKHVCSFLLASAARENATLAALTPAAEAAGPIS